MERLLEGKVSLVTGSGRGLGRACARIFAHEGASVVVVDLNPVDGAETVALIEQAGGAAIDGFDRILDIAPRSIDARTPLIFGSKDKVERIAGYYREDDAPASAFPLFRKRGLLRR